MTLQSKLKIKYQVLHKSYEDAVEKFGNESRYTTMKKDELYEFVHIIHGLKQYHILTDKQVDNIMN